jgi:acyl-CoA hydrolase
VVASGNYATPMVLLRALTAARERCRLFGLNAQSGWPRRAGIINETPFVGPGMRNNPGLDYLPMRLSLVPRLFDVSRPVDAVLLHTSMPHGGKVSLGIEVNILPAAIECARTRGGIVVAQLNPHMPYTFGDGELPIDSIDIAVEVDEDLPSPIFQRPDEAALQIGEQVAGFAEDGTTLQLGIGQIPVIAAQHMVGRKELGVWSEMVADGILHLDQSGSLSADRLVQTSFLVGSPELYAWADRNPRLRMVRTEVINDPARIAANPAMRSINAAMQVDLFAQANASYIGDRVYSGFGGQPDFVIGALHSSDGQAVVALRSWHENTDSSTVVPILRNPVTSFQHSAIVSEQGCARIFGRSQRAQAQLIIDQVSHPRARQELGEAAGALGLQRDSAT